MNSKELITIVECPRDAMQGWPKFIPTEKKVSYINSLLDVGFDIIDAGSFVSAKAIPQMADTPSVIKQLQSKAGGTELLTIVANMRGAQEAIMFEEIKYLGFPFSISETFQLRNTNSTITASLETVREMQELCIKNNKVLVVYISMGFGNPSGDPYSEEIVMHWVQKLVSLNVQVISIADTVGLASADQVYSVMKKVIDGFPAIEIGVHLHASHSEMTDKLDAALKAGCRRFDGAIKGIGGCPMAGNELVGNMDTEIMINYFNEKGFTTSVNQALLKKASLLAADVFI